MTKLDLLNITKYLLAEFERQEENIPN